MVQVSSTKYGSKAKCVCRMKRTQGETQTKKVWVSPAPERKKRTWRRQTNQIKRKKGTLTNETKYGSGLEGLRVPENAPTPEKNKN